MAEIVINTTIEDYVQQRIKESLGHNQLALDYQELKAKVKELESDRALLCEYVRLLAARVPASVFYVRKSAKQLLELLEKK